MLGKRRAPVWRTRSTLTSFGEEEIKKAFGASKPEVVDVVGVSVVGNEGGGPLGVVMV